MKQAQNKRIRVMTGTDIPYCSPVHPYAVAVMTKRVLDRALPLPETEFEYCCNTPDGIEVFEKYGAGILGFSISYFINGKKSTFKEVIEDMKRGADYVKSLIDKLDENQ